MCNHKASLISAQVSHQFSSRVERNKKLSVVKRHFVAFRILPKNAEISDNANITKQIAVALSIISSRPLMRKQATIAIRK